MDQTKLVLPTDDANDPRLVRRVKASGRILLNLAAAQRALDQIGHHISAAHTPAVQPDQEEHHLIEAGLKFETASQHLAAALKDRGLIHDLFNLGATISVPTTPAPEYATASA